MWNYKTPGIPDKEFERTDEVPITKEEVRTLQISKARLRIGSLVYDVGCGSGSISVEAALQIESEGKVFAIDKDPNAIELTKKNLEKFGINNVSIILGNAKEKISESICNAASTEMEPLPQPTSYTRLPVRNLALLI